MGNYRAIIAIVLVTIFLALLHTATPSCETTDTDRTREKGATGTDIVTSTVRAIEESGIFEGANRFEFLRRVARVETNDGKTAVRSDGGIWGVSMDVLNDADRIIYINKSIAKEINENFCFDWDAAVGTDRNELDVPLYSALAVMVRLVGRSVPADVFFQADLWIAVFNPSGDRESFISAAQSLEEDGKLLILQRDARCQTALYTSHNGFPFQI